MKSDKDDVLTKESINPFVEELILNETEQQALDERLELVRLQCVKNSISSPLYQERASKDSNYWKNFSSGRVNL